MTGADSLFLFGMFLLALGCGGVLADAWDRAEQRRHGERR